MRESIVIEQSQMKSIEEVTAPGAALASWIMGQVEPNRKHRDNAYKARWDEYYRIWRGKWSVESKNTKSERSRLIAPATQMAVDLVVAELVEALFSKEAWFDIPDDIADEQKQDMLQVRDTLLQDLYEDGIIRTMTQIIQMGALYGQFIAKIVIGVKKVYQPMRTPDGKLLRGFVERAHIYPVPVEPGQLVWDMSGPTTIDAMVGVAHEFPLGLHTIKQRQEQGLYDDGVIVGSNMLAEESTADRAEEGENPKDGNQRRALITEWHGLVPKRLLTKYNAGDDEVSSVLLKNDPDADEFVEAVVTIANESTILRAILNPSVMDDRAIVAEQFDTVPNRFMGRGIADKGYNSQKGLDTELRARADALAWTNKPMLAVDLNRLPPRLDLTVHPGKLLGTRGNPKEIISEFRFGDVSQSTFQQVQDYMGMHAQATGSQDPGQMRQGVRDESMGAAGIAVSGMVKRNRRTMYHLESFLNVLLRRIIWRKMQFDPQRYPNDLEFQIKGAIGMMAREVESQQLVSMLQYTQQMPQVQAAIVKALLENTASTSKGQLMQALDAAMKPDPEQQQMAKAKAQLEMQGMAAQVRKVQAESAKIMAEAGLKEADAVLKKVLAEVERDSMVLSRLEKLIDVEQVQVQQAQVRQEDRALNQQDRAHQLQERKLEIEAQKVRNMSKRKE